MAGRSASHNTVRLEVPDYAVVLPVAAVTGFDRRESFFDRATFLLCVGAYAINLLIGLGTGWSDWGVACLSASAVVERYQVYR